MMDFSSLPGSVAIEGNLLVSPILKGVKVFEVKDEALVYKDLSSRLIDIETKIDIEQEKVTEIETEAKQMMLAIDEKQELLMRCQWLFSLCTVKEQIDSITTMNELKSLSSKISSVQTCPLKKELMEQLSALEQTLEPEVVEHSAKDAIIEAVFEEGNETFINLGKVGRDHVLDTLFASDSAVTVEQVIAASEELEQSVEHLKGINYLEHFDAAITKLPLASLERLTEDHRKEVVQELHENAKWNGLFSLDRMVLQLIKQFERNATAEQAIAPSIQETISINDELMEQFVSKK